MTKTLQADAHTDPFLEAGIHIPTELPYSTTQQRDVASRMVSAAEDAADGAPGPGSSKHLHSFRRGIRKISQWTRANPPGLTGGHYQGGPGGGGGSRRSSVNPPGNGAARRPSTVSMTSIVEENDKTVSSTASMFDSSNSKGDEGDDQGT